MKSALKSRKRLQRMGCQSNEQVKGIAANGEQLEQL